MVKFVFALSLALWMSSSPAFAVDPVTAGTTNIGTHSSYGTNYSGFWRSGAPDYSLLTDGYHTYLNAPNRDGAILIRNANQDLAFFGRYSLTLYTFADFQSNINVQGIASMGHGNVQSTLTVGGDSTLKGGLTVSGTANFNGQAEFGTVFAVNQNDGLWTGVFDGTKYGLEARGSVYGVYSNGPLWASSAWINGELRVVGNAYKLSGGTWVALSDRRVKKDVTAYRAGLAEIEKVRPVRFKYNGLGGTEGATDQENVGVIAQEVEQIAPYMVSSQKKKLRATDKTETDIKMVDPNAFTYMLVNAVQELSQQNKEMLKVLCQDHPTASLCSAGRHLTQR